MKRISIVAVCLSYLVFGSAVWGEVNNDPDLVLVTGEHWTASSREQKVAYLFGIGNVLEVEQAMQGKVPASIIRKNSIVPVMINGLSDLSTSQLREMIDQWYEKKPDQLKRPVIEVLYLEFALPKVKSRKN
jgi:hypothetical protein